VKLLILDIRWPPETFLMRKIEALAASGYRITVGTADQARGETPKNVKVLTLPGSRRGWPGAMVLFVRAVVRDWREGLRGLREVLTGGLSGWRVGLRRWAIAAERPDTVHWEWTLAATVCLPVLEGRHKWHAVVSCRGSQVSVAPANPKRDAGVRKLGEVFSGCCLVHAVSEATAADAERLGLDRGKARVIRPAVDAECFAPRWGGVQGRFKVIMVGGLKWVRAPEHGLLAFRRAVDSGVDGELEVIGGAGKEERSRFLYTVQDLGLEGRVRWWGELQPEEVAERLRQGDILLHSSHSEGISNAVLEAMACGLPVVVTDAGGMREAVRDGVDGFVVGVRDVDAMALALERLARDPELRRRMGQAARQWVLEEFTLEKQTREWRTLYEGLAAGCRH
jgi:glycosyltransferase involved in cell wall biosynthesis